MLRLLFWRAFLRSYQPLAVAVQLQQSALRLQDALWTAKASGSGFSVSLFWPSPMSSGSVSNPPKKRRRRRKHVQKSETSA